MENDFVDQTGRARPAETILDPATGVPSVPVINPDGTRVSAGGGGGGLAVTDEAPFTAGVSSLTPVGGVYNDSLPDLTSGQTGMVRMSRSRAVSTYFDQPASSTATWTTATALNTALSQMSIGRGTAIVSLVETGTTTTAGALTFEGYDGTNWWPLTGQQVGSYTVQSSYTLVNGVNVAWSFDIAGFQQFRVRLSTAITGTGSPQAVVILQLVAMDNTIAPTVGWGQKLDAVNDAITSYPFGHSYTHIAAGQATTTIKSGAGVLHAIIVGGAATATNVTTLYDNTAASGTVIAIPALTAVTSPETIMCNLAFSTGLTVITATANGPDLTFIWR